MVKKLFILSLIISISMMASSVLAQRAETTPEVPEATVEATSEATPETTQDPMVVTILVPEVLNVIPHNAEDFTQGLVWDDGRLFQSTGLYGSSHLQELDPETGETVREVPLSEQFFGEGLALVDDQLIQITWQENTALVYDQETFEQTGSFEYDTEGWGICYDGESLYMSDGSSTLFQRDPETFEITAEIPVTFRGELVPQLNELECVEDSVYANVWYTDVIVRIDKETGVITEVVDVSRLLTEAERAQLTSSAVLNGIAYNADDNTFFITGKLWSSMYEVQFVPREG